MWRYLKGVSNPKRKQTPDEERPKTRSMKQRDEKDVFKMIGKRVDSG